MTYIVQISRVSSAHEDSILTLRLIKYQDLTRLLLFNIINHIATFYSFLLRLIAVGGNVWQKPARLSKCSGRCQCVNNSDPRRVQ